MNKLPTLKSARLILRPFKLSDAPRVQNLAGAKEIAAVTSNIPHPYLDGMAESWISGHETAFQNDRSLELAICLRENGLLIGAIGLIIERTDHRASLGYWLGKDYWNQGYCTEAAREIVSYGLEKLELNRIYATHFSHNPASGKVMEKLGMTKEGILKEHAYKWGHYYDYIYYGILKSDYERNKHA